MKNRMIVLAYSLFAMACLAAPSFAQDNEELKKDLTSVIALQGLPCGEVTAVTVLAPKDYAASCKDGNKYRVYENAQGRVIVEKRQ
jgi:hypothetical protein